MAWIGFHTFRHTCATMLFAEGRNAVQVQRWLGHHSAAFTLSDLRPPARRGSRRGAVAALSECKQSANMPHTKRPPADIGRKERSGFTEPYSGTPRHSTPQRAALLIRGSLVRIQPGAFNRRRAPRTAPWQAPAARRRRRRTPARGPRSGGRGPGARPGSSPAADPTGAARPSSSGAPGWRGRRASARTPLPCRRRRRSGRPRAACLWPRTASPSAGGTSTCMTIPSPRPSTNINAKTTSPIAASALTINPPPPSPCSARNAISSVEALAEPAQRRAREEHQQPEGALVVCAAGLESPKAPIALRGPPQRCPPTDGGWFEPSRGTDVRRHRAALPVRARGAVRWRGAARAIAAAAACCRGAAADRRRRRADRALAAEYLRLPPRAGDAVSDGRARRRRDSCAAGREGADPRMRRLRACPWLAAVSVLAYALALAPVLLAGRASFSSFMALSDSAVHLIGADFLIRHGQHYAHLDLRNSYGQFIDDYYNTSYPSGADTLFGGSAFLLGLPLIWAFQPFNAFMLALAAGPAWLLARRMRLAGGVGRAGRLTACCRRSCTRTSCRVGQGDDRAVDDPDARRARGRAPRLAAGGGSRASPVRARSAPPASRRSASPSALGARRGGRARGGARGAAGGPSSARRGSAGAAGGAVARADRRRGRDAGDRRVADVEPTCPARCASPRRSPPPTTPATCTRRCAPTRRSACG